MILKTQPSETWRTVDLGDAGDVEVLVRPPTWEQLCDDMERLSGFVERRIKNAIVDWRGVLDQAGEPVPFAEAALESACRSSPALFHALIQIANGAYRGLDPETAKNFAPPPDAPSTAEAAETEAMAETPSDDGPRSAD